MRMQLPNEVMSRELAPLLMRLADATDQTITVTARGVELVGRQLTEPIRRCKRIESLEHHIEEKATWAA